MIVAWLIGLTWTPCDLGSRYEPARLDAECTTLDVAEGRVSKNDKKITLRIARLSASNKAYAEPLVYLAGGPGQAASEAFASIAPAFDRARKHHDIYLIDQRGTGASSPLTCEIPVAEQLLDGAQGEARALAAMQACRRQLTIDPRDYATDAYVADLEEVRQLLAVERWHLYGISYGTRVAQRYITLQPTHVASAILDGVVAPGEPIGSKALANAERALRATWKRCADTPNCLQRLGDPSVLWEKLRTMKPRSVTVPHPTTGVATTVMVDRTLLFETLRLSAYAAETTVLSPFWLHDFVEGDGHAVASFALLGARALQHTLNEALHLSVICSEDDPALVAPFDDITQRLRINCKDWTDKPLPSSVLDLAKNDVPMLLLSGELDPITPPEGAERVKALSSRATHLVLRGQGHGSVMRGCVPKLVEAFLATPNAIDGKCVDKIGPAPLAITRVSTTP